MSNIIEYFDGTTNGYTWTTNTDNTIIITKYTNPTTTTSNVSNVSNVILNIPDTLGDKPVSIIGPGAFLNDTTFSSVVIPSTITLIGDDAFKGCSNLKILSFYTNSTLTTIGKNAFLTRLIRSG